MISLEEGETLKYRSTGHIYEEGGGRQVQKDFAESV